jgi:hypothetical protein
VREGSSVHHNLHNLTEHEVLIADTCVFCHCCLHEDCRKSVSYQQTQAMQRATHTQIANRCNQVNSSLFDFRQNHAATTTITTYTLTLTAAAAAVRNTHQQCSLFSAHTALAHAATTRHSQPLLQVLAVADLKRLHTAATSSSSSGRRSA